MYRWKGKIATKKQYEKRLSQQKNGYKRKKNPVEEKVENAEESVPEVMHGPRIVELKFLGEQLWCISCKEALSLQFVETEIYQGLASELIIRCHKCLLLNKVITSKTHVHESGNRCNLRYDINSKCVLGALHSGLGWSQLSKLFACINIPCFNFITFKKYEKEVGLAAEAVAKRSCKNAVALERQRSIDEVVTTEKLLPEEFQTGFIIPHQESQSVSPNDKVRVMVSYDMGWSTRGSGRNYDSLNGFGAVIGHYSGMVLDYATCNRKCKKCDNNDGHVPDHDCRRNFYGSAKAMEPCVGKKLVVESEILKSQNVEVGVLIGDDDSSTIAACRSASNHPILKQSDKNHASKGVKKQLYGIQKNHKELTKEGITYLHKCFTYAIAQNTGNSIAMAAAIRSIPHHAFNDHTQCGIWCGYIKNKENYDHRAVPGGFSNKNLFQDLKEVFYKLADNAAKFACGASSNRNESLNATMASKAPKSRCYSMSASADFRFSCSVAQKNLGEKYTQDIANQIQLSSGKHHLCHISKTDKIYLQRKARINTHQYKKKRMEQKKLRSILRYRRENSEGLTYESNCGLLTQPAVPIEEENNERDNESDIPIILFDLETSSLRRDCDILQIAAKSVKKHFDIYINPTQQVSIGATAANGLINCYGDLMHHGLKVSSVPMKVALEKFLKWIESFETKCGLAAHNLCFDGPRLYDAIKKHNLDDKFSSLIYGFVDTLPIIRQMTGKKGKGACTLSGLANSLNIDAVGAHNAIYDCSLLDKVLHALKITNEILLQNVTLYDQKINDWNVQDQDKENFVMLAPLEKILGTVTRKKLAKAAISLNTLQNVYSTSGTVGIQEFFKQKENKVVHFQGKTIKKIIDFLTKKN